MESFKNTIIILLLAVGLLVPIAQAKSPPLLKPNRQACCCRKACTPRKQRGTWKKL